MRCLRTGLLNNFFMTLRVPARALFDFNDLGIDIKKSCFFGAMTNSGKTNSGKTNSWNYEIFSDVDEFNDELQFDPTISSGFYRSLGEGGFRSTPITVGVCPTPQPSAPTPQPFAPPLPPTKPDSKVKRFFMWH